MGHHLYNSTYSFNKPIHEKSDFLDYLGDKFVFKYEEGFVKIPDGPALGIEINEEYVKKMAQERHNWKNPLWRHKDGRRNGNTVLIFY